MDKQKIREVRGTSQKVQIPKRLLNVFACKDMDNLTRYLSPEAIEFFRAYLLDYDIFSTIIEHDYGDSGWADICFSTAKALYKILTNNGSSDQYIYYDRQDASRNDRELNEALHNTDNVFLFDIDGNAEGHGFVVYPVTNDKIFIIQSAGGIMTANMRLLPVDYFIANLKLLTNDDESSRIAAQNLFGYYMDDNVINKITYSHGSKTNVNLALLINYISNLNGEQITLLQQAFEKYFDEFDIANDVELVVEADLEKPSDFVFSDRRLGPYYFVDPVTAEWRCVDTASELPHSTVSIGIRQAACHRIQQSINS